MTKKLTYIAIIVFVVLAVAGIAIGSVVLSGQNSFEKNVTLSQDDVTQEELSVSLKGLYPGKSVEYTVRFGGGAAKKYDLELAFLPKGETSLSPYIDLEVELNGEIVSTQRLSEYFEGEAVRFVMDMKDESTSALIFRYRMPLEVGNEAQNTKADFKIDIKVTPGE